MVNYELQFNDTAHDSLACIYLNKKKNKEWMKFSL